jgi:hypothetical protein
MAAERRCNEWSRNAGECDEVWRMCSIFVTDVLSRQFAGLIVQSDAARQKQPLLLAASDTASALPVVFEPCFCETTRQALLTLLPHHAHFRKHHAGTSVAHTRTSRNFIKRYVTCLCWCRNSANLVQLESLSTPVFESILVKMEYAYAWVVRTKRLSAIRRP